MLNVGLVGFGFAGQVFHAPVISVVEGLRLAAVARRSGDRDPRYPEAEFVRSLDELLTRPIDLVVIATPNTTHAPIAKQCLLAGKHVVIDKPFATTAAEAEELIPIAEARRVLLSVYQNRRYVGDFVTVRKLLNENALGRVTLYESHFDRFRPALRPGSWRERPLPGSGLWFDLGAHLLDQVLVLFGIPEAVSADIRIERDGAAVDDAADVTLHYSGMRAMLRISMLAAAPGPMFNVRGTKGSFVKYGLDPQEDALKAGRTPNEPDWDCDPPEFYGKLITPEGSVAIPTTPSNFTHYYENVRDAILGKAELAVKPQQSLDVMRGIELALKASQQRRTLPWPK